MEDEGYLNTALKRGIGFYKSEESKHIYADLVPERKDCYIDKCYDISCGSQVVQVCFGTVKQEIKFSDLIAISREEFEGIWRKSPPRLVGASPCSSCDQGIAMIPQAPTPGV